MTAAATDRILSRYGEGAIVDNYEIPMGAATTIYRGTIVSLDQSGYGYPGTASLVRTPIGVATESKANSGAAGAKTIRVEKGAFGFVNSSGDDAVTAADVNQPCYVADDQTVARTSANGVRPFAGRVVRVESSVIYVEVGGDIDPTVKDLLLEAAADLSSSQFLFVEMDTNGDVTVANAAGEDCVGVLQNAPASGAIAIVRVHGPSRVIGSAAVNPGALVATTSAGKSKTAVAGRTDTSDAGGATDPLIGSFVMGRALTLGASDAQHSIFVHPMGAIPTTAA